MGCRLNPLPNLVDACSIVKSSASDGSFGVVRLVKLQTSLNYVLFNTGTAFPTSKSNYGKSLRTEVKLFLFEIIDK
jgi:hypothetical protein